MIDHLGTRGYDPQQAYAICSCAVDLRMSQAVDVPNFTVSASSRSTSSLAGPRRAAATRDVRL
jgi:acetamidase/formamidase